MHAADAASLGMHPLADALTPSLTHAVSSRELTAPRRPRRCGVPFRLASVDPERDCSALTAQLSEACAVVDVLEPFVRDELTGQVCNREMTAYTQVSRERAARARRLFPKLT